MINLNLQRCKLLGLSIDKIIINLYMDLKASTLKQHKANIHDIGKHHCDFCLGNRNSRILYEDIAGKHHICRECYKKATGKASRVEHIVSDHLDTHFGTGFLLGSDKSLKSLGACQKYRPDKLYASPKLALMVEIDEHQHSGRGYSCEEKRISDIYGDFAGHTLVCIRWNPDTYKPLYRGKKKLRKERLEMLLEVMKKVMKNPPKEKIHIYYMFYNINNTSIAQHLPKTMIWTMDDVNKLDIVDKA